MLPTLTRYATLRLLAGLALALVLSTAGRAGAQTASCLPGCDPMNLDPVVCCPDCLDGPCAEFADCKDANREFVDDCVATRCEGRGTAGRCTITLRCVRDCRAQTQSCTGRVKRAIQESCLDCRIGKGSARRACDACFGNDAARSCADTGSEGSGSRCQRQCIRRQPRIVECNAKCQDRCEGDLCAVHICERACRDSVCNTLAKKCSPDSGEPEYLACCAREGDCDDDARATISCEPTTTSTTSTSTTSATVRSTTTTSTTLQGGV